MPPRRELNERFQSHIARARRVRVYGAVLVAFCVLASAGFAFGVESPSRIARESLDRLSSLNPSANLAAVSASGIAERIYLFFCPIFGGCPQEEPVFTAQQPTPQPVPSPQPPPIATVPTTAPIQPTPQPIHQTTPLESQRPLTGQVTQPVIERVVETRVVAGVTEALLTSKLLQLETSLLSRINDTASARGARVADNVSDNLANLRNNYSASFDTGTLQANAATLGSLAVTSNASIGGSLSVASDANMGGDLTVAGTITGGVLNVAGITSGGALVGPYVTATSTFATSTFAGALTVDGKVGIGTSAPGARLEVSYASSSTIPTTNLTNAAAINSAFSVINTDPEAAYSALHLQARTTSGTGALLGLAYGTTGTDGSLFFRIRNGPGSSSEVMRITSAGNVLAPYFTATSTAAASTFAGRVVIGATTSPVISPLAIVQNGPASVLSYSYADSGSGGEVIVARARGNMDAPAIVQSGDTLARIGAQGYTGSVFCHAGRLRFTADGNPATNVPTRLVFETSAANTSCGTSVERMRLDSAGNLGLGTTNPTYKLDVSGNARFSSFVDAAYFTATSSSATSTFAGGISALGPAQFANFSNFFGLTRFGATGTTTIATDGTIQTPSVSAQFFAATSPAATSTFAGDIALGGNIRIASNPGSPQADIMLVSRNGNSEYAQLLVQPSFGDKTSALALVPSGTGNQSIVQFSTGGGSNWYVDAHAANGFQIRQNSNARLTIVPGGNVGLGTTTPGTKLHVANNGPTIAILERDSAANAAIEFKSTVGSMFAGLTGTGNFGIGPSNNLNGQGYITVSSTSPRLGIGAAGFVPESPLHVNAPGNNNTAIFQYLSGSAVVSIRGNAASSQQIYFGTSDNIAQGFITYNNPTESLRFGTNGQTNRLVLDSSGNIGIGTTSPGTKLDVYNGTLRLSSSNPAYYTDFINAVDSSNAFRIRTGGTDILHATHQGYQAITLGHSGSKLVLSPANTNAYFTGALGIGSTTPNSRLVIQGDAAANSALTLARTGGTPGAFRMGVGLAANTFVISDYNQGQNRFVIDASGNVGIGTTAPNANLHVHSTANTQLRISSAFADTPSTGITIDTIGDASIGKLVYAKSGTTRGGLFYNHNATAAAETLQLVTAGTPHLTVLGSGNIGIGTTTPGAKLHVNGAIASGGNGGNGALNILETAGNLKGSLFTDGTNVALAASGGSTNLLFRTSATTRMVIDIAGNVGIGTTTKPDGNIFTLTDANGSCAHNPGAGSVAVSCSSDARLKADIQDTLTGLDYLATFRIRDYRLIADGSPATGVIAQEVLETHPELVSTDEQGFYRVELPNPWVLVKAIQDLASKLTDLATTVTSFADRIVSKEIVAENLAARRALFEELCLGSVCITESEFMAVFGGGASQSASASAPAPPSNPSEPSDQNPAQESEQPSPEIQDENIQNPSAGGDPDLTNSAQPDPANWSLDSASPEPSGNDQAPAPSSEAHSNNSSAPDVANDSPRAEAPAN